MTDNIAAVRNSEIDRVIGACTAMDQVEMALRHTLDL